MPKLVLKKNAKVKRINPARQMLNQKRLAQALWECLKDNDPESFIEIIDGYILAMSVTKGKLARNSNIPKTPLYHSLKSKNPTLKTLCKMIHGIHADD